VFRLFGQVVKGDALQVYTGRERRFGRTGEQVRLARVK